MILPHKFYPLVDDVSWLERLLPCGVKFVQLRIKDKNLSIIRAQIKKALLLGKKYEATIVINDYCRKNNFKLSLIFSLKIEGFSSFFIVTETFSISPKNLKKLL